MKKAEFQAVKKKSEIKSEDVNYFISISLVSVFMPEKKKKKKIDASTPW